MCYVIPLGSAMVVTVLSRRNNYPRLASLNLMLWGAAIFGVLDHLWHGELFLISPNTGKDLLLGATITVFIFAVWLILPNRKTTFFYSKTA